MAENEMMMNRIGIFAAAAAAMMMSAAWADAQNFSVEWRRVKMDGTRTGVTFSSADNVKETIGEMKGSSYHAPDGKVFRKGVTPKVARIMLASQPEMADVKQVVAYSPKAMVKAYPESALSDWFVDLLMDRCSEMTGRKVDVGFANFGGIRVDMPEGDVLMDDIMSMFPFRNKLCYLELEGRDVRAVLEQLAAEKWQVVGGARCVISRDGKLLSAEIGGEPIDDDKVYGVATLDFLLNGGDGLFLQKNALSTEIMDKYVIDIILPYVKQLTAEGKPLEYHTDGRIKIEE